MNLKKTIMCLMVTLVAQSMAAKVVTVENVKYDIDERKMTAALINGRNVDQGIYYIPSSIQCNSGTYTVTEITSKAFYRNPSIKEVNVPESVKSIEDYAFGHCAQLQFVSLRPELEHLGEGAFYGCANIERVIFNRNRNVTIKDYTFYGCKKLKSIEGYTPRDTIGAYAFANCTSLEGAFDLSYVKAFGEKAFYNCTSIEDITFSFNCDFGTYAFYNCRNIKNLEINSPKIIRSKCFMYCQSVQNITIKQWDDQESIIGDSCFMRCTALDTVKILDYRGKFGILDPGLNYEGEPIPSGKNVFNNTNSRFNIYVSHTEVGKYKSAPNWNKQADKIHPYYRIILQPRYYREDWYEGMMEDGSYDITTFIYGEGKDIQFELRKTTSTIVDEISLDGRNLRDSVEKNNITIFTLENVDSDHLLRYLTKEEAEKNYLSIDGILYTINPEEHTALIRGRRMFQGGGNLQVPYSIEHNGETYSVETIESLLGEHPKSGIITKLHIPLTVKEIGDICCFDFEYMESLEFDLEQANLEKIGYQAFAYCSRLQEVTLPNTLSYIGEEAFAGCASLHEIKILSDHCEIGPNAFGDNDSLVIWVPYSALERYKKAENWKKYADKLIPFYTIYVEQHQFNEEYWRSYVYVLNKSYIVYGNETDIPLALHLGDFAYQVVMDGKYLPVSEEQKSIHLENITKDLHINVTMKYMEQKNTVHAGKYYFKIDTVAKTADLVGREKNIGKIVLPASFLYQGERYTVTSASSGLMDISRCSNVTYIELPRMVSKLADQVCLSDYFLQEIRFSEYSRLDTIGEKAFYSCIRLENITLPSRLRYIGDDAFRESGLTEVTLLSGMCNLGEDVFGDVSDDFKIYVPAKYLQRYKNAPDWAKYKQYLYAVEEKESEDGQLRKLSLPADEEIFILDEIAQEETSSVQSGLVNVFNLWGQIVKTNVESTNWYENLQDGLYIVNGHKHIIKEGKVFYGK
jgi:hypothetical protein